MTRFLTGNIYERLCCTCTTGDRTLTRTLHRLSVDHSQTWRAALERAYCSAGVCDAIYSVPVVLAVAAAYDVAGATRSPGRATGPRGPIGRLRAVNSETLVFDGFIRGEQQLKADLSSQIGLHPRRCIG